MRGGAGVFAFLLAATGSVAAQPPGSATPPGPAGVGAYTLPQSDQPTASAILLAQDTAGPATPGGGQAQPAGAASGAQNDNGTNPAQNATTFVLSNEYYTLQGGNRINTTYARLKYPWFEKRGALLFEVPFVYYNFQASAPALPQIGGLGDIRVQASYNVWTSADKKLTAIGFFEAFLPSADNAIVSRATLDNALTAFNLGTGKYVLGPGVGFVYAFQPNFIVAPLYFYEASAFGNSDRVTIRRGKWRVFGMYAWESGVYTLPELQILTNYLTGNNDIYVAPEVGYSHKGTTAYVKPGIGITPDYNDRQWGLEVGVRVMY
ncbi:MAG: hypothetical protein U0871_21075 [Gemmataceae bacterium]